MTYPLTEACAGSVGAAPFRSHTACAPAQKRMKATDAKSAPKCGCPKSGRTDSTPYANIDDLVAESGEFEAGVYSTGRRGISCSMNHRYVRSSPSRSDTVGR